MYLLSTKMYLCGTEKLLTASTSMLQKINIVYLDKLFYPERAETIGVRPAKCRRPKNTLYASTSSDELRIDYSVVWCWCVLHVETRCWYLQDVQGRKRFEQTYAWAYIGEFVQKSVSSSSGWLTSVSRLKWKRETQTHTPTKIIRR